MLVPTSQVFITDKTGNKYFSTICSTEYLDSEVRNLSRKLIEAKNNPEHYSFLDIESSKVEHENYTKRK